jgi:hypothetical protein
MAYRKVVRGMVAACRSRKSWSRFGSRFPASRTQPPTAFCTRSSESCEYVQLVAWLVAQIPADDMRRGAVDQVQLSIRSWRRTYNSYSSRRRYSVVRLSRAWKSMMLTAPTRDS